VDTFILRRNSSLCWNRMFFLHVGGTSISLSPVLPFCSTSTSTLGKTKCNIVHFIFTFRGIYTTNSNLFTHWTLTSPQNLSIQELESIQNLKVQKKRSHYLRFQPKVSRDYGASPSPCTYQKCKRTSNHLALRWFEGILR
jgi:hypothetical protein